MSTEIREHVSYGTRIKLSLISATPCCKTAALNPFSIAPCTVARTHLLADKPHIITRSTFSFFNSSDN